MLHLTLSLFPCFFPASFELKNFMRNGSATRLVGALFTSPLKINYQIFSNLCCHFALDNVRNLCSRNAFFFFFFKPLLILG